MAVTATDPGGLEAQQQWAVTVKPNPDRAALEAFYDAAGGDDWGDNSNWLTDAPLGDWYGVDVNRDNRVVSLVLNTNNLKGRITPEIGNLTALETLSLRRNWRPGPRSIGLTGPIPREIGNLSKLTDVVLSSTTSWRARSPRATCNSRFRTSTHRTTRACACPTRPPSRIG